MHPDREPALVWCYVIRRSALRALPRMAMRRQATRLHAPQLCLLWQGVQRVALTTEVAEDFLLWVWSEIGEHPFAVRSISPREGTPPDSYLSWGLDPRCGIQADTLAARDAVLAIAADNTQTHIPASAWGRYESVGDEILRAYYCARVNYQLQGIHAGRRQLQHGLPEA